MKGGGRGEARNASANDQDRSDLCHGVLRIRRAGSTVPRVSLSLGGWGAARLGPNGTVIRTKVKSCDNFRASNRNSRRSKGIADDAGTRCLRHLEVFDR